MGNERKLPVTVFSIVYNTPEEYLRKAIESVLNQTFRDFEYVLFDNGSTDKTKDILVEYAERDARVRLVHVENNYWNLGNKMYLSVMEYFGKIADCFDGEYICSIDSDDWYETNFLELCYGKAKEHNADLVTNDYAVVNEGDMSVMSVRKCPEGVYIGKEAVLKFWMAGYNSLGAIWNKLFKAEVFKGAFLSWPREAIQSSDMYIMSTALGCCNIAVSTGVKTHNYLVRSNSSSKTITDGVMWTRRHAVLYEHALETLDALGCRNTETASFFQRATRTEILAYDLNVFTGSIAKSSVEVMKALETILTGSVIWECFNGFEGYEDDFKSIVEMAVRVQAAHIGKKSVAAGFLAQIALIYARTEQFRNVNKVDVRMFISAVFAERNINRAGRVWFQRLFEGYRAPFASCLAAIRDECFTDGGLVNTILRKDSVEILHEVLSAAYEANDAKLSECVKADIISDEHMAALGDDFMRVFPNEASLIYHDDYAKAFDELEKKFAEASSDVDWGAADDITIGQLRVAAIVNDGELFINLRKRRVELFTNAGMREKAEAELTALRELCDDEPYLAEMGEAVSAI